MTGGRDGCVRLWDIRVKEPVLALEPGEGQPIRYPLPMQSFLVFNSCGPFARAEIAGQLHLETPSVMRSDALQQVTITETSNCSTCEPGTARIFNSDRKLIMYCVYVCMHAAPCVTKPTWRTE